MSEFMSISMKEKKHRKRFCDKEIKKFAGVAKFLFYRYLIPLSNSETKATNCKVDDGESEDEIKIVDEKRRCLDVPEVIIKLMMKLK